MAQTSRVTDPRFAFPIPDREYNSMAAFQRSGSGIKLVNAYLLAKLSELVYPGNIDYQIRFLRNGQQPLDYPSSAAVSRDCIVTNANIEKAAAARCFHWFFDEGTRPKRPVPPPQFKDTVHFELAPEYAGKKPNVDEVLVGAVTDNKIGTVQNVRTPDAESKLRKNDDIRLPDPTGYTPEKAVRLTAQQRYQNSLEQYYLDSVNWEKENYPVFRFLWRNLTVGFKMFDNVTNVLAWDPEVLVISHKDLVIISFRGTDGGLGTASGEMDMGEWLGSNLAAAQTKVESGPFANTWVHSGFYGAFSLIEPDITRYLQSLNALDGNKKIWVTGHSLGGAMAQLTGVYLKKKGYNVQGVYTYASPRVIGNGDFVELQEAQLGNRLQRFEYYLDPVTMIYAPAYSIGGNRNWIDQKDNGCPSGDNCYVMHRKIKERYVSPNPCEFNRCPTDSRTEEAVRLARAKYSGLITDHPFRMGDHSVQWYVKSMWHQLTDAQQDRLPRVNDSWPFLYVSGPK